MKKSKAVVLFILSAILLLSLGTQLTLVKRSPNYSTISGTFATSQVDTVSCAVEGSELGYDFFMHPGDSVSVTNVILRRVIDGKFLGPVAGDTVVGAVVARSDTLIRGSVNVAPICQSLKFIVTYAGSAQGVTTPTVAYFLMKRY